LALYVLDGVQASCPTRRASDPASPRGCEVLRSVSTVPASSSSPPELAGARGARRGGPDGAGPDDRRPASLVVGLVRLARPKQWRSEEHTSELHSRENIVCRPLL